MLYTPPSRGVQVQQQKTHQEARELAEELPLQTQSRLPPHPTLLSQRGLCPVVTVPTCLVRAPRVREEAWAWDHTELHQGLAQLKQAVGPRPLPPSLCLPQFPSVFPLRTPCSKLGPAQAEDTCSRPALLPGDTLLPEVLPS